MVGARQSQRQAYRVAMHSGGSVRRGWAYPADLQPLPPFPKWLEEHVRNLRSADFPVPHDLSCLSCPPSRSALSYKHMWAYGSHFRCDSGEGASHVAYDGGVALVESEVVAGCIDVGTVEDIFLVSFGPLKSVVMRVSWIKHVDEGRRTIKKDGHGFWTVRFSAREDSEVRNKYIFPCNATQVFFVDDSSDPHWKVVVRHDPRSKRIVGMKEQEFFGAVGADLGDAAVKTLQHVDPAIDIPQRIPVPEIIVEGGMEPNALEAVYADDQYEEDELQ